MHDGRNILKRKNTSMKIFFLQLIFLSMIIACANHKKEIPDGGPCSYEDHIYPAKLIRLEASPDSSSFNPWFEIEDPLSQGIKDTISYMRFSNKNITKEQMQKDSIAIGSLYKYIVSTIKTGSCDPDVRRIILERY